jgi:hypothetical protein
MTSNQDIFDFETWASTTTRPTFQKSLSDALKTLATDADDLRDRLRGALFCLLDVDRSQIPKRLIAAYDEISDFVVKRVRDDPRDYAPWQSPLFALTKKMRRKTAERLARQIVALYEEAVRLDSQQRRSGRECAF